MGEAKCFLGLEILHSSDGIVLSQRKYAVKLIAEAGLSGAKPSIMPMEQNLKFTTYDYDAALQKLNLVDLDDQLLEDHESYQRLIGKLIYLTQTRPNIAFVVQYLSQFMS